MTGYLILTTPRSGSNLLCDGLRRAGLGDPDEWLGTSRLRQWAEDRGRPVDLPADRADLVDYLSRVREAQPGPVTGMKIHWHHVDRLRLHKPADLLDALDEAGLPTGAVVVLRREDRLDQAISTLIAAQTGNYVLPADGNTPAPEFYAKPYWPTKHSYRSPREPEFDADEITTIADELRLFDHRWNEWVQDCGLPVLQMTYEQLCTDRLAALCAVAQMVGAKIARYAEPSLSRQANGINSRFRDLYLCRDRQEQPNE